MILRVHTVDTRERRRPGRIALMGGGAGVRQQGIRRTMLNGEAVAILMTVTVNFGLEKA
jgi:hypothetical protein